MTFFSCFLQANKACKDLGDAILATIEDSTACDFIKGKLSANSWIGATDVKKVSTVARQLRATLDKMYVISPTKY